MPSHRADASLAALTRTEGVTITRSERSFTLIEIMIIMAVIALLASVALPNALRSRTNANETTVIGNMRALVNSLEMYRSANNSYPANGATDWRDEMYGTDCAAATVPAPDFGPPSFCNTMAGGNTPTTGLVQGYRYTYTGVADGATYTIQATPVLVNNSGTRSFYADDTGLIRHCTTGTQDKQATVASPTVDNVIAACP